MCITSLLKIVSESKELTVLEINGGQDSGINGAKQRKILKLIHTGAGEKFLFSATSSADYIFNLLRKYVTESIC
jgi:hypothetical protein